MMDYQIPFSNVIDDFLQNKECLETFLDCLDISELKGLTDLRGEIFDWDEFARLAQSDKYIDGFVIKNNDVRIYVINPSKQYIRFWGHRNFFTWRLAQRQNYKRDGTVKYVLNFIFKNEFNKIEHFDTIDNFYVINFYMNNANENVKNWLNAIYNFES